MPATPTLLAGRYRLGESLGSGGMGRVWLARDETLERDVAVKEIALPPELVAAERDAAQRRTLREARAAARLSHPGVVQVYDVLETGGQTWIVMEYVPSESLQQILAADGPMDPRRVARIGLQVLAALRAAHQAGVRHRDVKPANVLLAADGRVVLTDFGIATIEGDSIVTRADLVLGSPEFMSPERARFGVATPASDLWSLGATLYTAVEGRSPFRRGSTVSTLTALAADEPDPPSRAGVLRPVLDGLLVKDPEQRIDAAEAERRLRAALGDDPDDPPADRPPAPPRRATPDDQDGERSPGAPTAGIPRQRSGPADTPAARTAPTAADAPPSRTDPAGAPAIDDPVPAGRAIAAPAGRPEAAGRAADASRPRRAALMAVSLLVVLAVGLGTWLSLRPDSRTAARNPAPTAPAATTTAAATTPPTTRPSSPSRTTPPSTAAVADPDSGENRRRPSRPAGWIEHRDPTGFSVYVPAGWRRSREGSMVYFRDRSTGRVLGIDQSDRPKSDPVADWRGQADYRVARGDFPGYDEIHIRAVDYWQKAADWEFTFNGRTRQHVNNRGFVTSKDQAYGIYWQTSHADWAENRDDLQLIFDSFRPARN